MTLEPIGSALEEPTMSLTEHVRSPDTLTLMQEMGDHKLWSSRLLQAAHQGRLTLDDYRYVFAQYYAYSRNFTRYLAAVMASCPDDYLRSRLSENIWEEGGGAAPEERHAQIFRRFLTDALGLDPAQIQLDYHTRVFVEEYLLATRSDDHTYAAAFLALGTEAIVSRLYTVLVDGMSRCDLSADDLRFFHLHIGCDDEHAATLMTILEASRAEPGWMERARQGMNDALDARWAFFEAVYQRLEDARYQPVIDNIRAKVSLVAPGAVPEDFVSRAHEPREQVYANQNSRLNIDFLVEKVRAPGAQALEPRLVRIPAGRNNERHRHAHETLFYVVAGSGFVSVGDDVVRVAAGDTVFVPRWAFHQSGNTGTSELVILAITDCALTRSVLGDYDRSTRLKFDGADASGAAPPALPDRVAGAPALRTPASAHPLPMRAKPRLRSRRGFLA
jgi:pyrroloquinoline quinone (PQQ) biosynthesis protein C/quercetin dioxygenase-like cupin family protein